MSGFSYKMSQKLSTAARWGLYVAQFPKNLIDLKKVVEKTTYYPELKRKSKKQRWMDNFIWLCKNHELNRFYTSYGLDIEGLHDPDDFISYFDFMIMRNKGNQSNKCTISGSYNYIVLLRDKYAFSAYMESTIGSQYVVPNVALLSDGKAFLVEKREWTTVDTLLEDRSEQVYKVLDGECAEGVMLVRVEGDRVYADGQTYTRQEFVQSISGQRIIVQNVVGQHPALQVFRTRSVSTIRIVTIQGKSGAVNVFAAFLRLSASPDSFVDNRAKGGLGIGIDLDNGRLMKYGLPHDSFGVKTEVHPLSGIRFEGYQLPYWEETVELVCNAHKQFYDIQSIGWDVILTKNGPVLLEGNDDWEIGGPQDTYGGLKKRWNELVNE